MQDVFNNGMET